MAAGSLALILHAHLPFVRHPEHEDFLEEDWLFEAITETYLPLIRLLRRLAQEGTGVRLAMSLTPPLCAMLRDELLQQRYLRHLDRLIAFAGQEIVRHRHHPQLLELAEFYENFFREARSFYSETLHHDIVGSFRELQELGVIEIIASAATHGFLPLLQHFPAAQRAQIRIGCDDYCANFGRDPIGFWLPECGYSEGMDVLLQEANIRWFVVDAHALMNAEPQPAFAQFAPCFTPAGPAAFARDRESNREVWSAEGGYPGDPVYRDFYRDVGFDRPAEDLAELVRPRGLRKFTGIKYHRVSHSGNEKEFYRPGWAAAAAVEHAHDFFEKLRRRLSGLEEADFNPLLTCPFDAELFGHWWFEGPCFLKSFLRTSAGHPEAFQLTTPSEFLSAHPSQQVVRLSPSSWGENGFGAVWLQEKNAWIYPLLFSATRRLLEIAQAQRATDDPLIDRALQQSARELLLAQSSDWAFLLKTDTAPEYAAARTREHLERFSQLAEQLESGQVREEFLAAAESRTPIFPNLNWRYYL